MTIHEELEHVFLSAIIENNICEKIKSTIGDMIPEDYMRHKNDLEGLESYLRITNLISAEDRLVDACQFEESELNDGENDD